MCVNHPRDSDDTIYRIGFWISVLGLIVFALKPEWFL